MILNNVSEATNRIVKKFPQALNPDLLRHGDLHGFHVVSVPDWFEEGVGETEYEEVLNRLLAEIVINPKDL